MSASQDGGGPRRRTSRRAALERVAGPQLAERIAEQRRAWMRSYNRRVSSLGRRTDGQLSNLRDRHRGERCVIIGNGPSLNQTPLEALAGERTFGLNRAYLLYPRLGFVPTYHVVVNRLVVEQCAEELLAVPSPLFTTWQNRDLLGRRDDCVLLQNRLEPTFSRDIRAGIWEGATVTYVAMQIAFFLGFSEVLLVGVDHSFTTSGPAHVEVTSSGADPNHFDPNYFGKGFRWQLPDLQTSELAYRLAREAFESDRRRIIDCTVDGKLDVFPKADLLDVIRA